MVYDAPSLLIAFRLIYSATFLSWIFHTSDPYYFFMVPLFVVHHLQRQFGDRIATYFSASSPSLSPLADPPLTSCLAAPSSSTLTPLHPPRSGLTLQLLSYSSSPLLPGSLCSFWVCFMLLMNLVAPLVVFLLSSIIHIHTYYKKLIHFCDSCYSLPLSVFFLFLSL